MNVRRLFHFTCAHGRSAIGVRGWLVPQWSVIAERLAGGEALGIPDVDLDTVRSLASVIWLTSESWPLARAIGLDKKAHGATCDRMAYRYVVRGVSIEQCEPWVGSARRDALDPLLIAGFEANREPECWWITQCPTRATLG
jgi:hypothetical protein